MSGILGIVRFDGAPVETGTLSAMRDAMSWYGPDGGTLWQEDTVGLGHLLLRVTPEDVFEIQPISKGPMTIVCYARLDNRDELLRTFEVDTTEQVVTPDSALVLEAYLRWGDKCVHHLDGDWQFAAWDTKKKSLFVARDHFGSTGLYYYRNSRFFAFASNINGLLALPEVPRRPDMVKMAQVLTAWLGEGWRTGYEGICRLMPAHHLLVTKSKTKVQQYWHPENFKPVKLASDHEYVEQFLEIYEQAVRVRLRSSRPVAATLSGGLDSGSVVALAAPMLAAQGKRLAVFTSVPLYDTTGVAQQRTGNEWELASATARMAGNNIDHFPLRSEGVDLVAAIEHNIDIHCEPGHGASNHYWIEDLHVQAQAKNAGVMLTGQFGNFTVSYNGSGSLHHALQSRGLNAAFRMLMLCEPNAWLAIKRHILKPLLLPSIRLYRHSIKSGGTPWHSYSAIKPEFAAQVQIEQRMRENGHDPTFTTKPPVADLQAFILQTSIGARWHETGAAFGLNVRDPTADRRVIEFCMGLPDEQYCRQTESRWLIRRAMSGRMTDDVLNSRLRGLQAADLVQRVVSHKRTIADTLNKLQKLDVVNEVLDLSRINGIFSSIDRRTDFEGISDCSCIVLRGLGVGLFLAKF